MANLKSKTARKTIPASKKATFVSIGSDQLLGYRSFGGTKPGKWKLRQYDSEKREYTERTLPDCVADDLQPANGTNVLSFGQAIDRVRSLDKAVSKHLATVHSAISEWADAKAIGKTSKAYRDQMSRAQRMKNALPDVELFKLKAKDIQEYRDNFLEGVTDEAKLRSRKAYANRALGDIIAALNLAAKTHGLKLEPVWSVSKFPKDDSGNARVVTITREDLLAIIEAAEPDLADLLTFLAETGARPGEAFNLKVGDYRNGKFTLNGKTGKRTIPALGVVVALLDRLTQGVNNPDRRVFLRSDGEGWARTDNLAKDRFQAVQRALGMDGSLTLYAIRHTTISEALMRGASTVRVAQFCGTSVQMLEQTYAHFVTDYDDKFFGGFVQ